MSEDRIYLVKTVQRGEDGTPRGYGGFVWPEEIGATISAPDWNPDPNLCRGGLFGLRPGQQDPGTWYSGPDSVWIIFSADPEDVVSVYGDEKTKARTGRIEWVCPESEGAAAGAVQWLRRKGITEPIYLGVDVVGDGGTATAGNYGKATAGNRGTATAGNYGKATAGDGGTAVAGNGGTATAGNYGKATAGYGGTATAGYGGTATAGVDGKATAGHWGTATAGAYGTATAGYKGTATVGRKGILNLEWFDDDRTRVAVAYVGEWAPGLPEGDVIEPNVPYKLDEMGTWSKA